MNEKNLKVFRIWARTAVELLYEYMPSTPHFYFRFLAPKPKGAASLW
jgi:hypothetical protein